MSISPRSRSRANDHVWDRGINKMQRDIRMESEEHHGSMAKLIV